MSHAPRLTFLRHLAGGSARRRAPDLADMGTAFGLDEALEAGLTAPWPPGEPPPLRRAAAPVAAWRRWLGRKLGN